MHESASIMISVSTHRADYDNGQGPSQQRYVNL